MPVDRTSYTKSTIRFREGVYFFAALSHTLPLSQETGLSEKMVIAGYSIDPFAAGVVDFNLLTWGSCEGDCVLTCLMVRFWKENKCSHLDWRT